MAHSSKRGGGGGVGQAAAACREWKTGDLVLVKVRGFPAWPAQISTPEKSGDSHDPRKVCVSFFGTNEIAFCSPNAIQAFTQETRKHLSLKCQGKAPVFVRAVEQIGEVYEKLKVEKQDQIENVDEEVKTDGRKASTEKLKGDDFWINIIHTTLDHLTRHVPGDAIRGGTIERAVDITGEYAPLFDRAAIADAAYVKVAGRVDEVCRDLAATILERDRLQEELAHRPIATTTAVTELGIAMFGQVTRLQAENTTLREEITSLRVRLAQYEARARSRSPPCRHDRASTL